MTICCSIKVSTIHKDYRFGYFPCIRNFACSTYLSLCHGYAKNSVRGRCPETLTALRALTCRAAGNMASSGQHRWKPSGLRQGWKLYTCSKWLGCLELICVCMIWLLQRWTKLVLNRIERDVLPPCANKGGCQLMRAPLMSLVFTLVPYYAGFIPFKLSRVIIRNTNSAQLPAW